MRKITPEDIISIFNKEECFAPDWNAIISDDDYLEKYGDTLIDIWRVEDSNPNIGDLRFIAKKKINQLIDLRYGGIVREDDIDLSTYVSIIVPSLGYHNGILTSNNYRVRNVYDSLIRDKEILSYVTKFKTPILANLFLANTENIKLLDDYFLKHDNK